MADPMLNAATFVATTQLADVVLAAGPNGPVLEDAAPFLSELERRCGPEVAGFFAQPTIKLRDGVRVATWYATPDGTPRPLHEVDDVGRRPFEAAVRRRLAALVPHLADPTFGPALGAALNLRSARDVFLVGNDPVLVNWGTVPAAVASAGPAARADHTREVFGRYGIELPPLPVGPPDLDAFADAAGRVSALADAVPPGGPNGKPAGQPTGIAAAPLSRGSRDPIAATAPVRPGGGRAWLAPAVASGVAGLVLLFLLLPGVLRGPDGNGAAQAALDEEGRILAEVNRGLEVQLAELRARSATLVCRARPGTRQSEIVPVTPDVLPPSSRGTPVPAPAPGGPTDAAALADAAVVLVRAVFPDGAATGSAFFVSDRLLVTNSHVVLSEDGEAAQSVTVENRTLGRRVAARVIARTDHRPENAVDLAILEVEPGTSRAFLRVAEDPTKTEAVRAVGFPGALLPESGGSIPDSSIGDGTVSTFVERQGGVGRYIVHTAAIFPGNSGGPLIDLCSRAVGVNTAILSAARGGRDVPGGFSFAQGASTLATFLGREGHPIAVDTAACAPPQVAFASGTGGGPAPATPPGGPPPTAPPPGGAPPPAQR